MKFYVLRHGETEVNAKMQINGHNDITLNQKGIEQAKEAGKKIKDLQIDLVFCSPLKRTKETCKNANVNEIEVIYDERIIERDTKSMQYEPLSVIDFKEWYDRSKNLVYVDSEGFKKICERTNNFIEDMKEKYPSKNILVVTHGDVCKAFYVYFNPNSLDEDIINMDNKIVK